MEALILLHNLSIKTARKEVEHGMGSPGVPNIVLKRLENPYSEQDSIKITKKDSFTKLP